jgi:hypothetical protein
MGNLIPEKAFDAQMHIIRDVHFDVDKYKVGELYVINQKDPGYLSVQGKTIAQLREVNEHELKFKVLVLNYDPKTGNSYNTYSIGGLRFTIDDIIDKQIEIERLLTETEAAVYLASVFVKESANDLFKSQLAWQKGPVGVNYFCTPEKHQDDTSKECAKDIEAKQSTLDPKDPKFNRLLGIAPDHSQFPYTLERTHSYQELQAAYKIDTPEEAAEIAKDSQMNIVEDIMKAAEEEKKNYAVLLTNSLSGLSRSFSILDYKGDFDPEPFKGLTTGSGRVRVKLVKGNSTVQFNVHSKYIKVTSDAIIVTGNKNKSSICMTLMRDNFREMFDKIEFEQIL